MPPPRRTLYPAAAFTPPSMPLLPSLFPTPGGIRQQFKAAQPMVEQLLKGLRALPGLGGGLGARILDDGDAVAAWEGTALAAVLFPTGESLKEVRKIAEARP